MNRKQALDWCIKHVTESLKYLRQQMYANHYPDHLASSDVSFGQLMKDLNR